jgi:hypothetical protein
MTKKSIISSIIRWFLYGNHQCFLVNSNQQSIYDLPNLTEEKEINLFSLIAFQSAIFTIPFVLLSLS